MAPTLGMQLVFQNYFEAMGDDAFYQRELGLGLLGEQLGFDQLWVVEHHFDDYAMSPDNFATLAYYAARTDRIALGVGAAILPWNDPLRVAEKAVLLDHLSGGRTLLALGRGLARREYIGFRQDMNEARGRFDEAAAMVVRALETGFVENDGPFYPQPRVEIRPRVVRSFQDRLFAVAMSPDSVGAAADVGGAMMSFVQGGPEKILPSVARYREHFQQVHGRPAPRVVLSDLTYCHSDPEIASQRASQYLSQYYLSVIKHYDFAGEHFGATAGYQAYAEGARLIREAGHDAAAQGYVQAQLWGTPDQFIKRFRDRIAVIGPYDPNFIFSYAGMPFDMVEESMALFAAKVMPAIREILEEEDAKLAA
ncbi:LLM class flavin-dependent oxidoreductase [Novosphingobium sp.]|uniref:LLM class flavin-dependent oxidoreductase n=1 Tax=Novosphingobium sp. TaxID=1874826 RepID=UPI003BABC9EE